MYPFCGRHLFGKHPSVIPISCFKLYFFLAFMSYCTCNTIKVMDLETSCLSRTYDFCSSEYFYTPRMRFWWKYKTWDSIRDLLFRSTSNEIESKSSVTNLTISWSEVIYKKVKFYVLCMVYLKNLWAVHSITLLMEKRTIVSYIV